MGLDQLEVEDFVLLLHRCHEGVFADRGASVLELIIGTLDLLVQRVDSRR